MTETEGILERSNDILGLYKQKKRVQDAKTLSDALHLMDFDDLELKWNPDGTLNHLIATKDNRFLYELHFAWNSDGTLSKIMRVSE